MPSVFQDHKKIISEKTIEYQDMLKKRIEYFKRDLELYWEQLQEYVKWGDIKKLSKYAKKSTIIDKKLTLAMAKIDEINEEEAAYGWELSWYPLRKQCADKLLPFKKLFDAGQEFMDKHHLWMHSQVGTYEPEDIEETIGNLYRAVYKLEKQFSDSPNSQRLATGIKVSIDEFKLHLALINTLGNPGMRDRHWEQVSEIIGFPIKKSPEMTLEKVIDYGLAEYVTKFEPISESATKENNLDKSEINEFFVFKN